MTTRVMIEGSTISNNAGQGVVAARAAIRMRNSTVTGNGRGLRATNGGQIVSHGGNVVTGNSDDGAFDATVAQQ